MPTADDAQQAPASAVCLRWQSSGDPAQRTLILAAGDDAHDLARVLPACTVDPSTDGPLASVVVVRGRAREVARDRLARIRLAVLIDPDDDDLAHASAALAGHPAARLARVPSLRTISAAEHTMLLLLALSRRLFHAYSAVVSGERRPGLAARLTGVETATFNWAGMEPAGLLWGRTLGIVGLGRVGEAVAVRAAAFGMRVLYHDTRPREDVAFRLSAPIEPRRFDQLLRESDAVSLHLPLNAETVRLIDAPELALMKPDAVLLNTAHGRLIDEGALIKALRQRQIAGAGLDVFVYEPLPHDSPLLALDNVVLTPHVAGVSPDAERWYLVNAIARELLGGPHPLPLP